MGVGSAAAVPGAVSSVRAGSSCTGTGFFFRGARGFLGAGVPSVCAAGAAISAGSAGAVGAGFAFLAVFLAAGLRPGFFSVWAGDFSASVTSFFSSSMVGCCSFLRPTGGPGGINTVWGRFFGGEGGDCLPCRRQTLPLAFFFSPIPPSPFPAGRGRLKVISCKGLRPLHPRGLNPRFAAKPTERFPYGQCRQPRRGGTGGDGTIRRKRRRRLRWSSPPGQVEPVPHRNKPPTGTPSFLAQPTPPRQ